MSDKKRTKNLQRRKAKKKKKKDLREERGRRVRGSPGREWASHGQHGSREPTGQCLPGPRIGLPTLGLSSRGRCRHACPVQ